MAAQIDFRSSINSFQNKILIFYRILINLNFPIFPLKHLKGPIKKLCIRDIFNDLKTFFGYTFIELNSRPFVLESIIRLSLILIFFKNTGFQFIKV